MTEKRIFPFRLPHQCDTDQGGERVVDDVGDDREIVRPNKISVSHCVGSITIPLENKG